MKKFLFLLAMLLLLCASLQAQTSSLGIGPDGVSLLVNRVPVSGDTAAVFNGDLITYSVQLINNGNTALVDEFGIGIGRSDDSLGIVGIDTLFGSGGGLDTLLASDTLRVTVDDSVNVNTARYSGGGGVVTITIWPAARVSNPGLPPSDTAKVALLITTTSLDPRWQNRGLTVLAFPNPAQEELYLSYGEIEKEVECVRIRDMQGRILRDFPGSVQRIDLSGLPAGAYLLQVQGTSGQAAVLRIVKR